MSERDTRQEQVRDWCAAAFGEDHANSIPQRGIRLLEEAIELAQAAGCEREMCHKLLDHIFDKPAGDIMQELGSVGTTTLAFAAAAHLSADGCEKMEVERVLSKPLEYFAARNKVKNDAGFNVTGAYIPPLT